MDIIKIALKEYKTHQFPGVSENVRILQYFRETGRPEWKSDEIPWCAIFANWCLVQIGAPTCGRGLAASFLEYGTPTNTPELGDIVVFSHPETQYGLQHVSFFVRKLDGLVYCLGGNQSNEVNITAFQEKEVTAYRKIPKAIAPDDVHNKYNTATGQLNPKYNPNA